MTKTAILLTLMVCAPAAALLGQDAPAIATTTLQSPELVAAEPAALTVMERNVVVNFALMGHRLRGTHSARLYIRMPGSPWQEAYAVLRRDAVLAVELVSFPFLAQPGRVEFKTVVDGVDSNILAIPVVR